MSDGDDGVSYETREVDAEVKPQLTMYDEQVIDHLEGQAEMAGRPRTIEYACGHALVQSDRKVTPATCPECGARLTSGGEDDG